MQNKNETKNQLLVLIAPTNIKDDLVDTLMSLECISGFNFSEIGGYSKTHSQYDIREQVQGYRKLQRFEVLHKTDDQTKLLDRLKPVCSKAKTRYWITPIKLEGHFSL